MYRPREVKTKAQFDLLLAALRNSDSYKIRGELQRLSNEKTVRLPPLLAGDGQVNGGNDGRNVTVPFLDPGRTMAQLEGIQSAQFKLRIVYAVDVPALGKTIDCYSFTGPVDSCVRAGDVVTMTARGCSALLQRTPPEPFTIPKGVKKTEAIKRIAEKGGELRHVMNIVDRPATLNADFTVGIKHTYWSRMKYLANEMDLVLAYNGPGELNGRPEQTSPSFTFRTGDHGFLTAMPNVTANFPSFHNEVRFAYGDKGHIMLPPVKAPPEHPLSAESLKWNGVPRHKILHQTRKTVKRKATAQRIAQNILDRELLHTVSVAAECFPFPFFEEGDLYKFQTGDYVGVTTITDWSMPLSPGEAMTLGWTDVRHGR